MSKIKEQIDSEIEQMAEKMTKSVTDSKQLLFDTMISLGAEGLKKAASELSEEEQALLKATIEELTPKKTETKASDMKQEVQSGSTKEDENLMDAKDANHKHQGGPKDSPLDGQVIKSEKARELVAEGPSYPKEEYYDKILEEGRKEGRMEKADKDAVKKLINMEEAEHKVDINGDGKIAEGKEKLEKDKEVKKALEEIVGMAKAMNMSKEDVVKEIKDNGQDMDKVKQSMQSRMDKMKARKSPDKKEDEKPAPMMDKKEEEPKKDEPKQELRMEKSVVWSPKNSIAANTLGRNTHYDVDAYIEKSESDRREILAKGGYMGETQGEPLKKSEHKVDINDLIEKGMDYSTDEIKRIEGIQNHKVEGKIVKSFHDEDIARALGMSKEEYLKLMGE